MVFGLVSAQAGLGLIELEPSTEKRLKNLDFVDICADLVDHERQLSTQLYPHEVATMSGIAQRFLEKGREEGRQEGREEGMQQGMQRGEATSRSPHALEWSARSPSLA